MSEGRWSASDEENDMDDFEYDDEHVDVESEIGEYRSEEEDEDLEDVGVPGEGSPSEVVTLIPEEAEVIIAVISETEPAETPEPVEPIAEKAPAEKMQESKKKKPMAVAAEPSRPIPLKKKASAKKAPAKKAPAKKAPAKKVGPAKKAPPQKTETKKI